MTDKETNKNSSISGVELREIMTSVIEEKVTPQFEKIDQRFEQIDQRFEKNEKWFDRLAVEFINLNQRFDRFELKTDQRFNELMLHIEKLETQVKV